jgi:hypothetical protein
MMAIRNAILTLLRAGKKSGREQTAVLPTDSLLPTLFKSGNQHCVEDFLNYKWG